MTPVCRFCPSRPPADIVIVAIDRPSLARIGRWPWRRAVTATLLNKLPMTNVAAIGVDIISATRYR